MSNTEPALRSLADALEAGLSPRQLIDDATLSSALPAPVRTALRKSVATSSSLGDAMRDSGALDDGPAAILVASERGGFLPRGLRLAADCVKAAQTRRRRAFFALAYPAFLVVCAGVILPLPLIFTKGAGAYFRAGAPFVLSIVAVLVLAFVVVPRLPMSVRANLDRLLSRVPLCGAVVVEDARAACFEVLGALIAAGSTITSALPAAVHASGLASWRAGIARAEQALARGGTLAEALHSGGFIDDARAGRVALAERTGTLDKALPLLATEARDKAQRRFASLVVIIGLVCFGAVAVGVGMAVVSGAQSYFNQVDSL